MLHLHTTFRNIKDAKKEVCVKQIPTQNLKVHVG